MKCACHGYRFVYLVGICIRSQGSSRRNQYPTVWFGTSLCCYLLPDICRHKLFDCIRSILIVHLKDERNQAPTTTRKRPGWWNAVSVAQIKLSLSLYSNSIVGAKMPRGFVGDLMMIRDAQVLGQMHRGFIEKDSVRTFDKSLILCVSGNYYLHCLRATPSGPDLSRLEQETNGRFTRKPNAIIEELTAYSHHFMHTTTAAMCLRPNSPPSRTA